MKLLSDTQAASRTIKAGDVFASRSRTPQSLFIRIATLSLWSHIAIALDERFVLEATKRGKGGDPQEPEINATPIDVFLSKQSAVLHLSRPKPLSRADSERLREFQLEQRANRYTSFHAALTALLPLTLLMCSCIAIIQVYDLWAAPIQEGKFSSPHLASGLVITALVYGPVFVILSSRIGWGEKAVERLFERAAVGRIVVEQKHAMFCSKLVILADQRIGGDLGNAISYAQDAQPKHIVRACRTLGWKQRRW